jgi:hypothetical protein
MALLDSFFGETPAYYGGLLGEDELKRLQGQASNQSQMTLANALLRAGAPSRTPGGGALAISEGLQMGQQAYKQALNQGLQEKMQGLQVQDMLRKRQEQTQMRQLFPQIFNTQITPDQQVEVSPEQLMMRGQPTQGVVRDDEGNMLPGGSIVPAQMQTIPGTRTMSVDTNKLQALAAMSSDPLATYASLAKLVPDLRKAGFIGAGAQGENPFNIFVNDATIPAPLRAVATQYQKSYASGQLDPEKADERVRQLATSVQSSQQFQQTQAGLAEARLAAQDARNQSASIQKMLADEKLTAAQEKRDLVTTGKSEAKTQLTDIVGSLKKNYETLKEQGGIVSTTESGLGNLSARLSSSGFGQAVGGAVGGKSQEERQKIEQTRPLLLNLIKNATGMSAQQMNSNAEMQLYLNAATNPQLSYEANLEALKNLDKLYGLGNVAKDIEKELKNPAKPSGPSKSGW